MRQCLSIGVNIEDDNLILDGDCSRHSLINTFNYSFGLGGFSVQASGEAHVRVDDCTSARGILDILDPDRDPRSDDLLHSEGMDNF